MNIKYSKGFTIIEALVAMVILAIGVLGLGVVQLMSLQNTQGGQTQSQAAILAYDMIDAVRANPVAVSAGNYNLAFFLGDRGDHADCYGAGSNCTPAEMADADMDRWREALTNNLVGGEGAISSTVFTDVTQVRVDVRWIDVYAQDRLDEEAGLDYETLTFYTEIPL
jgi:type IV pilus assembly protein PilV